MSREELLVFLFAIDCVLIALGFITGWIAGQLNLIKRIKREVGIKS